MGKAKIELAIRNEYVTSSTPENQGPVHAIGSLAKLLPQIVGANGGSTSIAARSRALGPLNTS